MPTNGFRHRIVSISTIVFVMCLLLLMASCDNTPDNITTTNDGSETFTAEPTGFKVTVHGFMRSFEASPDAAQLSFSITGMYVNGKQKTGVLITADRDGTMYIAIDISSLLGEEMSKLRTIEADIAIINAYDDFYAVSGEVSAIDAAGSTVAESVWSVYLAEKNPNIMRLELTAALPSGPHNMLIISKIVDNAQAAGLEQSSLFISEFRFYDGNGELLTVDGDAGFIAPAGFGEPDRSNLDVLQQEIPIDGARGTSNGWGQAVTLLTSKNGGVFDATNLVNSIVTVYYTSSSPPELILQSWTEGKPDSAGWAKVAPYRVNDSGNIAQFRFDDMVEAFGTDDFEQFLDQLFVGDTGAELAVFTVTYAEVEG